MGQVHTATTSATSARAELRTVRKPRVRTSLPQCLVVSPSAHRAGLLRRAAVGQGWETVVVPTAEGAARQTVRSRVELVVVDLQSVAKPDQGAYRQFVEQLAPSSTDGPLLIVCGDEEDAMGEIWSRQLGVWMYLPGVDEQSDIALVCGEARSVVEKRLGETASSTR